MDFWKALNAELKRKGFSAPLIKQLHAQFGNLDADDLAAITPDDLVRRVNAAGRSLKLAAATDFLAAAKVVSLNVTPFTIRLIDVESITKPALGNVRVRVQRLDTVGKPEAELFSGRASAADEVTFETVATQGTPASPVKVRVQVFGLDDQPLYDQATTLDEHKPEILVGLELAAYRKKIAAPLADLGTALGKPLSTQLAALYTREQVSTLADLRRQAAKLRNANGLSASDLQAHANLLAHAELQLISRDHKLNQLLIDANFKDVFAIARLSRAGFLASVKGKIDEKTAGAIHSLVEHKVETVKNLALERKVAHANGYAQARQQAGPPPCSCDCQSAVSPLAYLADLLDLVLREVTYDNHALTLARLEELFRQPFGSLPGDCSASETIVRQLRICSEVLRSKALAEGKDPAANDAVKQHPARAYDALLAALGTSSRELRLLRGAPRQDRERKAQALGIAESRLNDLLLQGAGLSELRLETLFGLQDSARDPLSSGAKLNDPNGYVLRWQLRGVEWRRNTAEDGKVFGRLRKPEPNKFMLTFFNDSARLEVVAKAQGSFVAGKPSDLEVLAEGGSGLYGRVLVSDQAVDMDFELAVVPQLLIWQSLELIRLWQVEDNPEPDPLRPILPIVDPDMLSEAHFCRPLKANTAYILWLRRAKQLQAKHDELDKDSGAERTVPQMIALVWPANPPDWANITADLQSNDEDKTKARLTELAALHLSAETFGFLKVLRDRALAAPIPAPTQTDPEILRREQEEREQAIDILLNVIKRRDFYPAWLREEKTNSNSLPASLISEKVDRLSLSQRFFCIPSAQLAPTNPLRVSAEQLAQWLSELECNSRLPIVDPDVLHPFPNIGSSDGPAETLRTARRAQLDGIQAALIGLTPAQRTRDWLDKQLGDADLQSGGQTLLHSLGLPPIDALQTAFDNQQLDIQPQQYGLTARELNALLTIRKRVVGNQADDLDRQRIFHILIQAEKRRYLYPVWHAEEAEQKLTLSPEFFRDPDQPLLQLLAEETRPPELLEWRGDPLALRAWRSQLSARYQQQMSLTESLRTVVDRAEEAALPALRDALIDVLYANPAGTRREENQKAAANALLINTFESGCRKTTRVAQAIESLQLLVWGILNHQIEDPKFRLPDQNQADFDANWRWLASYATWRSAMFVFMYPENLLLPGLLPQEGKTLAYKVFELIQKSWTSLGKRDSEETVSGDELAVEYAHEVAYAMRSDWGLSDADYFTDKWLIRLTYALYDIKYIVDEVQRPAVNLEISLHIPVSIALEFQRRGDLDRALQWYKRVYDIAGSDLLPFIKDLLGNPDSTNANLYNGESWLNDKLNPHLLAATRRDAHMRFIQISIIRCLLDYAEAEYTADTPESVPRARELYFTAQRMLDLPALKQNLQDCASSIGRLILEVGERYSDRPDVRDAITGAIIDHGLQSDPDLPPDVQKEIDKIVHDSGPLPRPLPDIRRDLGILFTTSQPVARLASLEQRRARIGSKQDALVRVQLHDPLVFETVQALGKQVSNNGVELGPVLSRAMRVADNNKPQQIRWWEEDLVLKDTKVKVPGVLFEFCIPPNPILIGLRLRTETGLFKLSNCMNLAGLRRETPAYAASSDTRSGLPVVGISGTLTLPQAIRLQGTQYRYKVLVERAKQLVGIAQQMEANYLAFLDKLDQETYSVLKARQDLGLANANVMLQGMRVTEAEHGQTLAIEQLNRVNNQLAHFTALIETGETALEKASIQLLKEAAFLSHASAHTTAAMAAIITGVGVGMTIATGGVGGWSELANGVSLAASAMSTRASALSTDSSYMSMQASFDRRLEEWEFQKLLSETDTAIAKAQQTLADDRLNIVTQEQTIATIGASNAEDVLNFLDTKFTSAELYSWMSGVVGGVYRYFLQQSTSIAKLAQMQLAFERQEVGLDFILSDYWSVTSDSSSLQTSQSEDRDRRGMTGSARLLHDLYQLDQHAFTTDRRKLQLNKTLSLALHDPIAFQQFRDTGVLPFRTTLELFDRDFPGHYLRLIKRVRTSVIALIPPTHGIKATLSTIGISQVVVSAESGGLFELRDIPREPESVALTAPINDSGVFELQEHPEMLLPFEGLGVAGGWEFRLPKAANAFDFGSIADVLVTIEYTALSSSTYCQQVIQKLDRSVSADRPFSFRQQFADAWYDLHNSDLVRNPQQPMVVSFNTRREDFPPNIADLKIAQVTLFIAHKPEVTNKIKNLDLHFTGQGQIQKVGGSATTDDDGVASTRRSTAGSWRAMYGKSPVGEWILDITKNDPLEELFEQGQIADILFVLTVSGTTPKWPV